MVREAAGLPAPVLAFANHGDDDYARTELDAGSVEFALTRLHELPDQLLRSWSGPHCGTWSGISDSRRRGS